MSMDIGKMRERVEVQQPLVSRTAIGETTERWATTETRWASVEGVSSREYLQRGQEQSEITHRVRMRYVPGITSRMRLVWRGRALLITSLTTRRRRSELELLCLEDRGYVPETVPLPAPVDVPEYLLTDEGQYVVTETEQFLLTN